jgi:hypothetical protein
MSSDWTGEARRLARIVDNDLLYEEALKSLSEAEARGRSESAKPCLCVEPLKTDAQLCPECNGHRCAGRLKTLKEGETRGMERAAKALKNREDIFGSRLTENLAIKAIRELAESGEETT